MKRLRGGGLGEVEAPTLGTLEDMLRKSSDAGISLHRGHFLTEEALAYGGWMSYLGEPERWMKEGSGTGPLSARDSMK